MSSKYQDYLQSMKNQYGYERKIVKQFYIPTEEETREQVRQSTAKAAGDIFSGGLLAAVPGLTAAAIKPEPAGKMTAADIMGGKGAPQPFTGGTMEQVVDRKIGNLQQERQTLLNADLPSSDAGALAAANRIGQIEDEIGDLEVERDRLTNEKDMAEVMTWTQEERESLQRYFQSGRASEISESLKKRYSQERMEELAESYQRYYNQEKAGQISQQGRELGQELGFLGVVPQVGIGLLNTAADLLGVTGGATKSTGRYMAPDPYRSGRRGSIYAQGIGQGAAEKAPEQLVDLLELAGQAANPYAEPGSTANYRPQIYESTRGTEAGEVIDTIGSGAYQVVNTAADSLARAYLGGAIFGPGTTAAKAFSLGLAGVRSFDDTFNSTLANGNSVKKAAILGVFDAGTEIATEYIPLDEWWKVAERGSESVGAMLRAAARQGAIEMTQEEIGFLATAMAEYAVLREKSEYQILKQELIDSGMSPEDAERAMWEEFGRQAAGVAVTSFFSGGLSEAGAEAYASLYPGTKSATTEAAPDQTRQTTVETAPETTGKESVPQPETVSREQTPVEKAQEYYRQNGTISNSMAEAILADNEALEELGRAKPLKLDGTKSQNRAEIKAAVGALTESSGLSADGGAQVLVDAMADLEEAGSGTDGRAETEASGTDAQRLWSTDRGENGWGSLTDNSVWATALAVKETNPELFDLYEKAGQSATVSPVIDAVIAASQDVRQGTISPMAAAAVIDRVYRQNGVQGLGQMFSGGGGNLNGVYLEQMKAVDTESGSDYDRRKRSGGAAYAKQETDAGTDRNRNRGTDQGGAGRRSTDTSGKPGEGRSLLRGEGIPKRNGGESVRGEIAGPGRYTDDYDRFDGSVTRDSEGKPLREGIADALHGTTVVDGNGAPIAVYHGTPDMNFAEFRNGEAGHHFGTLQQAEKRINTKRNERGLGNGGGRVFRAFLNVQNPVHVDVDIGKWDANSTAMLLRSVDMITDQDLQAIAALATDNDTMDSPATKKLHEVMERNGIDGIAYPNMIEGDGLSYMVPNPDQVIVDEVRVYDQNMNQTGTQEGRKPAMGAADRGFTQDSAPKTAESKVYTNTYANATDEDLKASGRAARKEDRNIGRYEVATEQESLKNAQARTLTKDDIYAEYDILMRKPRWSGEDNDTAMIVLKQLMADGDVNRHRNLSLKQREMGTAAGQMVQSFAKYSREDTAAATDGALKALYDMGRAEVDKRFWKKSDGKTDGEKFLAWQESVAKAVMQIGAQIDGIEEGDLGSMRQVVRELAQFRRTTAWFGARNNLTKAAEWGIERMDFDSLKTVAKAQLGQIPNDFRKLGKGQAVKSLATMNMLSSLVTVNRNLVGNTTMALVDAFSDSTAGQLADVVLSKFTGQRTVGNDIKYGKEYFRAAWDAACMASLCAELAIPIDDAEYTGATRTFSPQGNLVTRFLSGYEMGMKYALEVTDKFFEGGARASVKSSLAELGQKSGLTQEDTDKVAGKVGLRRTYKEGRALSKATKAVKAGLNYIGTENVGAGDVFMPFAGVPGEVGQVGVDYTVGIAEGIGQMIGIIKDVKAGNTVDPTAQRAAAANFGRGVTGVAMIATFTALALKGAIKVFDDEDRDKASLEQSLGLSDAVWNLSASWRLLTGKDGEWAPDDIKINLGFLQPFNAQMYIGAALAEEDGFWNMVKAYPVAAVSSVAQSIMDIPMFGTFEDIVSVFESFGEAGENPDAVTDAVGQLVGNVGTRAIPSWVRQLAQYADPYYRDTSGGNALEKAGKQMLAAIPGASKLLPMKYDALGNPQLRYQDKVLGFFNTFISPGRITGATAPESAYDIATYLEALSDATGSKTMYPDYQAPKNFTMDGEKVELTQQQRSEYQRVYGENISDLYGQLMADEVFMGLDPETQNSILGRAKTLADDYAKAYTVGKGDTAPANLEQTAKGLIRAEITSAFGEAFDSLTGTETPEDRAGAIGRMEAALEVYKGLTPAQKTQFLEDNGGRIKYFINAAGKGVKPETFATLYEQYRAIDNSGMTQTEKGNAWAAYLHNQQQRGTITKAQMDQLRHDMVVFQMFPVDPAKLDEMVDGGMDETKALNTIDLLAGLEPLPGKSQVSSAQKWEAIAGAGMSDAETDTAMKAYMPDYNPNAKSPDRTELKYDAIREMGYSPEEFVEMYIIYSGTNGKWNKTSALQKAFPGANVMRLYAILSGSYFKD